MKKHLKLFPCNIFLVLIVTIIFTICITSYLKITNLKTYEKNLLEIGLQNEELLNDFLNQKRDSLQKEIERIKSIDNSSSFRKEISNFYKNNNLVKVYGIYRNTPFIIDKDGVEWNVMYDISSLAKIDNNGVWTEKIDDFYLEFSLKDLLFTKGGENNYIVASNGDIKYSFLNDYSKEIPINLNSTAKC